MALPLIMLGSKYVKTRLTAYLKRKFITHSSLKWQLSNKNLFLDFCIKIMSYNWEHVGYIKKLALVLLASKVVIFELFLRPFISSYNIT